MPPRRPQRGTQSHFPRSPQRPRKLQVGDIHAGDQQHEKNRSKPHKQVIPKQRTQQKPVHWDNAKAAIAIGVRVLPRQARSDGVEFRLRLGHPQSRLEHPYHRDVRAVPRTAFPAERERSPQLGG